MPPAHAACLAMLAPVFTMQPDGRRIYAPAGRPLEAGEQLDQPGLVRALELLAAEGPDSPYVGSIAESLVSGVEGIAVSRADLEGYEPRWDRPAEVGVGRAPVPHPRAGSPASPRRSRACRALRELDATARVHALLAALDGPGAEGHTTNLVTADSDGNACVLTSSLGLGTGDFLPGLDLQLNSMLGEVDLVLEPLAAGRADAEHDGPEPGSRRATGSCWRSALRAGRACGPRSSASPPGSSTKGSSPIEAVARPRFHRAGDVVNAEPGVDEQALAELEAEGLQVRRWQAQHHYFGGVSLVGAGRSPHGDPRRERPLPQRRQPPPLLRSRQELLTRRLAIQVPTRPSAVR